PRVPGYVLRRVIGSGTADLKGRDSPPSLERPDFDRSCARWSAQAHDGGVQPDPAGGTAELGVAEAEDPAVGGHEPVAVAGRGGGHADDGLVEVDAPGGAEERGVAVAEDPAVPSHEPVAVSRTGGHAPDDRLVEAD